MPLQATSGAASYDAFGGGVAVVPNYIEDVFSAWLYTGTGAAQTITNGIDLSGKGGMVWIKARSVAEFNVVVDTARGASNALRTSSTAAQINDPGRVSAFTSSGFTIGTDGEVSGSGNTHASWTFRKQPKFFDVVTWTGDSTSAQTISHNLGSVPGCIIVKRTNEVTNWIVYHRGMNGGTNPLDFWMKLNLTDAQSSGVATNFWANTNPTATDFTVGPSINSSSGTYVAYLFAHNAGGFGLTGTDNVISCGSFTTDTSGNASVTLGYEPQWVLTKRVDTAGNWVINDNMRGMPASQTSQVLYPNLSNAESSSIFFSTQPNATGFTTQNYANTSFDGVAATVIYIAIRRGPMRTPTTGTSVFSPNTQTGAGTSAGQTITTNFPVDLEISSGRSDNSGGNAFVDRLRGGQNYIQATNTNAEVNFTSWTPLIGFANNTGITDANYGSTSASYVAWNFRRAPGFFDKVCYTGTGVARTVAHNLGVVPELMIVKRRNTTGNWNVYSAALGATKYILLNSDYYELTATSLWNDTAPTSSVFTVGTFGGVNASGGTYAAYLFASCPGVSKVGSYTGTGTTQTINCGFTAGSRFVLIKRTDFDGAWYVWDSARGIVAGNDPYLLLNSTAAEVTNTDFIDTAATGFEISSTAPAAINANGGTFIFLAIA